MMSNKPIIREAEFADRFSIVTLGKQFHQAAGNVNSFPFDPIYAEMNAKNFINDPHKLLLVYCPHEKHKPVGFLAAQCYDHPLWPIRIATESLWWVDPLYRGRQTLKMIDMFEEWAQSLGCHYTGLVGLNYNSEGIERLYNRMGYNKIETHYMKKIT